MDDFLLMRECPGALSAAVQIETVGRGWLWCQTALARTAAAYDHALKMAMLKKG